MESTATLVADYASRCYAGGVDYDYDTMSPFTVLAIYRAAVVHGTLFRRLEEPRHGEAFELLKRILANFKIRWAVAGSYISRDR
jgi:hypothetical protein